MQEFECICKVALGILRAFSVSRLNSESGDESDRRSTKSDEAEEIPGGGDEEQEDEQEPEGEDLNSDVSIETI